MDALCLAAPLARLLLALSERQVEGVLSVVQRSRSVRASIAGGRVLSLAGAELCPLGDALLSLGELDVDSQKLLLGRTDATLIGARLVALGATSASSVRRALELQLSLGVESLLRWPTSKVELQRRPRGVEPAADDEAAAPPAPSDPMFAMRARSPAERALADRLRACSSARQVANAKPARAADLAVSVDLTSVVWSALLALAGELPATSAARLAGDEALALSVAGARRVQGLLRVAETGELTRTRELLAASNGASRRSLEPLEVSERSLARSLSARPEPAALPLRALLKVLGATHDKPDPSDSYALLLRKTRELSRNECARVLLDLPADLPSAASAPHVRRAFRKLARKLHPDRFQAGDARLHALSLRVMGALTRAEHALRT